jgi:hypothetical protein
MRVNQEQKQPKITIIKKSILRQTATNKIYLQEGYFMEAKKNWLAME